MIRLTKSSGSDLARSLYGLRTGSLGEFGFRVGDINSVLIANTEYCGPRS